MINSVEDWRERGFHLRTPPVCLIAYDPAGDGSDYDAVVIVNREEHQKGEPWDPDFAVQRMYRVMQAIRLPNDLEFPDKLALMLRVHMEMNLKAKQGVIKAHVFCVETNGIGYGMSSSLRSKIGRNVCGYVTVGTSTNDAPQIDKRIGMPRLAALDNLRILAETHHLKMSKKAKGAKLLTAEMNSFVWARPGRPEAITGQNDDLVMALCGACWIGEKILPPTLKQEKFGRRLN